MKFKIVATIAGFLSLAVFSMGYAQGDCCDVGTPAAYICEDGSVVCRASDCPPCSEDNPNPSSSDKVCCNDVEIDLNPSVSYNGDSSIWKGDSVTWTVSGGCLDDFSVSGTGFSLSGSTISYTASASSASNSDVKKPSVSYDGSPVSVGSGPVVYEIVDTKFDKASICEKESSVINVTFSPSGGSPPALAWSPSPITPAGALASGHTLSPGKKGFQATGDRRVTAAITVVDDNTYTAVRTPNFNITAEPNQPFSRLTIKNGPMISSSEANGYASYHDRLELGRELRTSVCGGEVTESKLKSYTIGLNTAGTLSKVTLLGHISYSSNIQTSKTWGQIDRYTKVQSVYPMRDVKIWVTHEGLPGAQNLPAVNPPYILAAASFVLKTRDVNVDEMCCGSF